MDDIRPWWDREPVRYVAQVSRLESDASDLLATLVEVMERMESGLHRPSGMARARAYATTLEIARSAIRKVTENSR